ncbi:MAG: hypothetical protein U5L10_03875 [Candidatus Moranbacteria bacterium]|nr:hypothetical protein [Candidatus Moranbacteria bacterium]
MSQASKMILIAIVAALISGTGVYLWQTKKLSVSTSKPTQEQVKNKDETNTSSTQGAVEYNCELSGGSFDNGVCVCPIEKELGQTQEAMYDENTGFCQTTEGKPNGDAFAASVGLPYGDYAFYNDIVQNNCEESDGDFLYTCDCPGNKSYDKSTGYCN